jgi:hypothetical protein
MKHYPFVATSYWPGYVDVLVNVVLNMLFVVGLMAVGLMALNVEALGNFVVAKSDPASVVGPQDHQAAPLLSLSVGTSFPILPLAQELAFVQTRSSQWPDAAAPVITVAFAPLQLQADTEQIKALQTQVTQVSAGKTWLLVATVPKDMRLKREVAVRLNSVREALILSGVSAQSIMQRMVEQDAAVNFSNGRRIFVYTPSQLIPSGSPSQGSPIR